MNFMGCKAQKWILPKEWKQKISWEILDAYHKLQKEQNNSALRRMETRRATGTRPARALGSLQSPTPR